MKRFSAPFALLLAIQLLTQPAVVWAQGAARAAKESARRPARPAAANARRPLAETLSGGALKDYAAARLLYRDGDFESSLSKLKSAYEASGDPRLLWNMAACHKNLRRYAKVHELVVEYREAGRGWLTRKDLGEAKQLLEVIQQFISATTLLVEPDGATVLLDGKMLGNAPLDAPVVLDIGTHRLRISKPGYLTYDTAFEIKGGSPVRLEAKLAKVKSESRLGVSVKGGGGATVNGDRVKLPWSETLLPGRREVTVNHPIQAEVSRRYLLRNGEQAWLGVDYTMEKHHTTLRRETNTAAGVPSWVWLVGATVLGSAVGGFVLLQAKDDGR